MIVLTPPPPAPKVPKLILVRWRAWEVQVPNYDAPSWHLMGYLSEEHCAKISSALETVSAAGDEARTKTHRVYALTGQPGVDPAAARLWIEWQRKHRVAVLRDVTSDVLDGRQPVPVRLIRHAGAGKPGGTLDASLRGYRNK